MPAIKGIGGSLLYFVTFDGENDPLAREFDRLRPNMPQGVGFHYLDHLTHNVFKGNMDRWSQFYADLFNFSEIGFFKIDGKFTGLISRALTSPAVAFEFLSTRIVARLVRLSVILNAITARVLSILL